MTFEEINVKAYSSVSFSASFQEGHLDAPFVMNVSKSKITSSSIPDSWMVTYMDNQKLPCF
jgi:hypothetical protein